MVAELLSDFREIPSLGENSFVRMINDHNNARKNRDFIVKFILLIGRSE
jgi:hypothetical protein